MDGSDVKTGGNRRLMDRLLGTDGKRFSKESMDGIDGPTRGRDNVRMVRLFVFEVAESE